MPRCLKKEDRRRPGVGCCKEVRHKGICVVRPDAEALYAAGGPAPKGPRAAGGGPRAGSALADADRLAARIETEVEGLMADCRQVVSLMQTAAGRLRARNAALLKSLVKSRRSVARLRDDLVSADDPPADPEGSDPDDEDPDL